MSQSQKKDVTIAGMHFTRRDIAYIAGIIVSALIYSLGMNSFVKSGNLFPGGYAGISRLLALILSEAMGREISFSIIYWVLNAITTLFVWRRIGHKFVLYSVFWFSLTSLFTAVIRIPVITHEILLISIFGGLINGFAIGISLRCNASSGGSDFIAIDIANRLKKSTWNYVFFVNAGVLVIAGMKYGWTSALYSIIFQFVSTQVVNSMHQRYKVCRVQIVTDHPEEISAAIFHHIRHGITKLRCEGEFSHESHWLLLTTINTYQINEVITTIKLTDPKAFVSVNTVERVVGNYYQKPLE